MNDDFDPKFGRSQWGEFTVPDTSEPVAPNIQPKRNVLLEYEPKSAASALEAASTTSLASNSTHGDNEEFDSDNNSTDCHIYANSLQESIVAQVVKQKDAFFKSQQRDEPALSNSQKKEIALDLLQSNPSVFLSRYGKHLEDVHFEYFQQFQDNYEVKFYLAKFKSAHTHTKKVKNRRYHAMKALIKDGEYFSMPQMKERNPKLFEDLVGKYMSEEDKEAMDQRPSMCNLSTVLMAHMERDEHSSQRRKDQEAEEMAWEEEEDEGEELDDGDDEKEEADNKEKKILEEEFVSSMYSSFVEGRDKNYDYSLIDDNSDYDDLELEERDAQERYFDSD